MVCPELVWEQCLAEGLPSWGQVCAWFVAGGRSWALAVWCYQSWSVEGADCGMNEGVQGVPRVVLWNVSEAFHVPKPP
jgi:hypothetical protein